MTRAPNLYPSEGAEQASLADGWCVTRALTQVKARGRLRFQKSDACSEPLLKLKDDRQLLGGFGLGRLNLSRQAQPNLYLPVLNRPDPGRANQDGPISA